MVWLLSLSLSLSLSLRPSAAPLPVSRVRPGHGLLAGVGGGADAAGVQRADVRGVSGEAGANGRYGGPQQDRGGRPVSPGSACVPAALLHVCVCVPGGSERGLSARASAGGVCDAAAL